MAFTVEIHKDSVLLMQDDVTAVVTGRPKRSQKKKKYQKGRMCRVWGRKRESQGVEGFLGPGFSVFRKELLMQAE